MQANQSAREAELEEVRSKAEHYEDKSMSMKLFTTVKVRAEMIKDFLEGKMSTWDPVAASSAWEEIKLLYSDSEGEDDQHMEERAGLSQGDLSRALNFTFASGVGEEEVGAEDVTK